MAPVTKRKHVTLTLKQKLEILEKLDKGQSATSLALEYGCGRQTISDFKNKKEKLRDFAKKHLPVDVKNAKLAVSKVMKLGKHNALDEATYKWYNQTKSTGLPVRGVDIQDAATKLAREMGIQDFTASGGWLWRFRRRHAMGNRKSCGETASADHESVGQFQEMVKKLINDEGLLLSQIYNFDETGLFWRALPTNTQAHIHCKSQGGRKLDKSRVSILLGANADGSHKVKPVIVGKSARPRVLKDCINQLPCHYYAAPNAWFNAQTFVNVFRKIIVPAIERFQVEELKLTHDRVRAVVLLDNAPAHPHGDELVALGGRIRCIFLPPNTTSLIQPMDQSVIQATKMRYKRIFLKDVLEVIETEEDKVEDRRGMRTLANLKAYNLKSAIFNFATAWKNISATTLANAWKPLLRGEEEIEDFTGFEVADFRKDLQNAGEIGPSEDDVEEWLARDEGDPGYELLSPAEIAASVMHQEEEEEDIDSDEAEVAPNISLADARKAADTLMAFVDQRSRDLSHLDTTIRELRSYIITNQYQSFKQRKIDSFFQPRTPSSRASSPFHSPSPSRTPTPTPSTSGTTTFRPMFSSGGVSDSESE